MAEIKSGSTVDAKVIATVKDVEYKADAVDRPVPISPLNNTENVDLAVVLNADSYRPAYSVDSRLHRVFQIALATDVNFDNPIYTNTVNTDSVSVSPSLDINQGYLWRCRDVSVGGDQSDWSEVQAFTTANIFVVTPSVTVEGSPSDVSETPTLTGSAFTVSGGSDTHVSSDWEIRRVSNDSLVWSATGRTGAQRTSIVVDAGFLVANTAYKFRVKYNGSSFTSAFGETQATTMAQFFVFAPSSAGAAYGGGYYAGQISIGGTAYALVVAPRAQGGLSSSLLSWKTSNTDTPNTGSVNDGASNTSAMIAAGAAEHPAANFCNNLNINGYSDWYLPAKDELEICYRYLKPITHDNHTSSGSNANAIPATGNYTTGNPAQTSVTIFKIGNSEEFRTDQTTHYWSSTQYNASGAWIQGFPNGSQMHTNPPTTFWVRAVRKVAI